MEKKTNKKEAIEKIKNLTPEETDDLRLKIINEENMKLVQELDQVKQQLEQKTKEYDELMKQAKQIIAEKDKRIMELVSVNELYINMVKGK